MLSRIFFLDFSQTFPDLALPSVPLVAGWRLHLVQLALHRRQLVQNLGLQPKGFNFNARELTRGKIA